MAGDNDTKWAKITVERLQAVGKIKAESRAARSRYHRNRLDQCTATQPTVQSAFRSTNGKC